MVHRTTANDWMRNGANLIAQKGVTSVEVTDKEPTLYNGHYCWFVFGIPIEFPSAEEAMLYLNNMYFEVAKKKV